VATRAKDRVAAQQPKAAAVRRDTRANNPEAAASPAATAMLQRRIEEAEAERLALEKKVADAFTRGDHREGTHASKQLERHRARLDDLYEQWAAAEG
jgi:hypothetical protein